jgi:hypothetical protein
MTMDFRDVSSRFGSQNGWGGSALPPPSDIGTIAPGNGPAGSNTGQISLGGLSPAEFLSARPSNLVARFGQGFWNAIQGAMLASTGWDSVARAIIRSAEVLFPSPASGVANSTWWIRNYIVYRYMSPSIFSSSAKPFGTPYGCPPASFLATSPGGYFGRVILDNWQAGDTPSYFSAGATLADQIAVERIALAACSMLTGQSFSSNASHVRIPSVVHRRPLGLGAPLSGAVSTVQDAGVKSAGDQAAQDAAVAAAKSAANTDSNAQLIAGQNANKIQTSNNSALTYVALGVGAVVVLGTLVIVSRPSRRRR